MLCLLFAKFHQKMLFFVMRGLHLCALFVQQLCYPRAVYLHRALGAELLAAEAADAKRAVDHGLSLHDLDGAGGTDLTAEVTADALLFFEFRACGQDARGDLAEDAAKDVARRAREAEAMERCDVIEVVDEKVGHVAVDRELLCSLGNIAATVSGEKGGYLFLR